MELRDPDIKNCFTSRRCRCVRHVRRWSDASKAITVTYPDSLARRMRG